MLTPETRTIFARELGAIRHSRHPAPTIGTLLASAKDRHADYETHYAATRAALQAMERRPLILLAKLGGPGCLSGSLEFRECLDALERRGLPGMNHISRHDRAALVAMFADVGKRRAA